MTKLSKTDINDILSLRKRNISQRNIAKIKKVSKTTIQKILKPATTVKTKRKKNQKLDASLIKLLNEFRQKNICLSGPVIKNTALELSK